MLGNHVEMSIDLRAAITELVHRSLPGAEVTSLRELGPDGSAGGATTKGFGYGRPVEVHVQTPDGPTTLVFHTETPNPFGHDRPSDRARDALLAHHDFPLLPRHTRAIDVGAIDHDGRLVSLAQADEWYLLTTYAPGHVYADDLRRIAAAGSLGPGDASRAAALGAYLAGVHATTLADEARYRRAIRDLVGSGEGIYGIVDGYPDDTPGAPRGRLREIEQRAARYRETLAGRGRRLARTHGDFHPFNVLFDGDELHVLDASRGAEGDPADDVACMAVNYPFFALGAPGTWATAFRALLDAFWSAYHLARPDDELAEVAPPFVAWRALVIANPIFYPTMAPELRDAMLSLAERALDAGRFDPELVDGCLR